MKNVLVFTLIMGLYIIALSYPVHAEGPRDAERELTIMLANNDTCSDNLGVCYALCGDDANCQHVCEIQFARCTR